MIIGTREQIEGCPPTILQTLKLTETMRLSAGLVSPSTDPYLFGYSVDYCF